ncbi:MAG TPA: transporter, partial [Rhodocyclaceae bacterium]
KWRFFERGALSLGFKPGITLPTGDEKKFLGAGRVTWGALLIGSYEPGPLAIHSHVGYRYYDNVVDLKTSLWHVSVASTWQLVESLKLVADLSRDTNPVRSGRTPLDYVILGAIWTPRKYLDLDFGYRHGASGPALDRGLLAGLTLHW